MSPYIRLAFSILLLHLLNGSGGQLHAQEGAIKRQPYVDLRRHYLGFRLGGHTSDLRLSSTGDLLVDGSRLWAETPSYHPGFHVGLVTGWVIVPNLELRFVPTLQLGSMPVAYSDGQEEVDRYTLRWSTMQLPVEIKWGAERWGNYRPFLSLGAFVSKTLGGKQGDVLRLASWDYGLSVGAGCDIYFSFFKLSPQLIYYHGLGDVIQHQRPDLEGDHRYRYTQALRGGQSRGFMLTLSFE